MKWEREKRKTTYLTALLDLGKPGLGILLLSLALLEQGLRDKDLVLGGNGTVGEPRGGMSELVSHEMESHQEENCSRAAFSTGSTTGQKKI